MQNYNIQFPLISLKPFPYIKFFGEIRGKVYMQYIVNAKLYYSTNPVIFQKPSP